MIASLYARIKGWLVAAAVVVIALAVAYFKGRRAGGEAVETQLQEEAHDALVERIEVETDVARRPDGDAAQRLRDNWSRD